MSELNTSDPSVHQEGWKPESAAAGEPSSQAACSPFIRMESVLSEIRRERERQNAKWGEQNHHPFAWLAILGEEIGEASQAAVNSHFGSAEFWVDYRKELIHAAAVLVAMCESFDRNGVPNARLDRKEEEHEQGA